MNLSLSLSAEIREMVCKDGDVYSFGKDNVSCVQMKHQHAPYMIMNGSAMVESGALYTRDSVHAV